MPVIRATRISKIVFLNPDEAPAVTMTNCAIIGGSGPFGNLASLPPGMSVELDHDSKAAPDIFFHKVEGAPPEPVIPTPRQFRQATAETINAFEAFMS